MTTVVRVFLYMLAVHECGYSDHAWVGCALMWCALMIPWGDK